ncbi:MAG: VOC family protein [Rhodococcus sp.]|uniref:VOC family protein n=1 Tax=Rhodococcus TaxID=1827 RepID=UPI0016BC3512|nr:MULTISPECIES: VOC family protein [Rhodococcus]NLV78744.1 VOC family protein [Rhodococcus sp. (in: high G+C Gram-positive bacteria)]
MTINGQLVSFVPSTDLDVSEMFYVDTLGFRAISRDAFALVIDGGDGAVVRITLVQSRGETGYTALGWRVTDLDATVDRLRERGVEFVRYNGMDQDDHDAWTAPDGLRVAWFRDPHSNVLSLMGS